MPPLGAHPGPSCSGVVASGGLVCRGHERERHIYLLPRRLWPFCLNAFPFRIHHPTQFSTHYVVLRGSCRELACALGGYGALGMGGGWVGLGWIKASPGRLPTVRAAFPAGPDWAAVPGCPVTRPAGLLTAPRPRGGARGREMPPRLCVCALVCLGGGGGAVAHLLAPLLFGRGAHAMGTCVPGAPGPGREAGEPDSEPAGGDVGLGSQPPRHKDILPNHSKTAYWHGKAVVRGTTGVRPALLDCLRHRWCCLAGWVRLPRPRAYPGQVEGHQGAECASLPWVPPVLAALAAALQPA